MGAAVAVASYGLQLLGMLPSLIQAGQSLMPLIQQGQAAFSGMAAENRAPTKDEWDLLNKMRDALHAQMQS